MASLASQVKLLQESQEYSSIQLQQKNFMIQSLKEEVGDFHSNKMQESQLAFQDMKEREEKNLYHSQQVITEHKEGIQYLEKVVLELRL